MRTRPRSLATTFLIIVTPMVGLLMMAMFSLLEAKRSYEEYRQLFTKLELMGENTRSVLSLPLWNVDDKRIELIINSLQVDPDIVGVAVFDENADPFSVTGTLTLHGINQLSRLVEQSHSDIEEISSNYFNLLQQWHWRENKRPFIAKSTITFGTDAGEEVIGTLFIALSDHGIHQRRSERLYNEIVIALIVLCALILATLLSYWVTTYRPLRKLQKEIQSIQAGDRFQPMTRCGSREINAVIDAFNALLGRQVAYEQEQKNYQQELKFVALHDDLTGLPNRLLFDQNLAQSIARSKRSQTSFALLFLDLDRFKDINDSLGHDYGDALLKEIASRLDHRTRETDTVCRFGGDEFAILLDSASTTKDITAICEELLFEIRLPFSIRGHDLQVGCSIGITMYPEDGDDPITLLRNADSAMYLAKEHGKDGYEFFSEELRTNAHLRLQMENAIQHAIRREELILHYQPLIDATSGKVRGVEALVRWMHPERGLLFPDRFITLAEESGTIIPIGEWVLRSACRQNHTWQQQGLPAIPISVNISARQFHDEQLVSKIAAILDEVGLDPAHLELELTEGTLIQDNEQTQASLSELNALGVSIAIDDFGTGYSSLTYLRRFPIHTLKIDRSLMSDIIEDADNRTIVEATIEMAHKLGKQVVAEGIETTEQANYLTRCGCDLLQGYLFSRPIPHNDFESLSELDWNEYLGNQG